MQPPTSPRISDLPDMVCTVQPHPTGGFTPIAHLDGAPVPAPGAWAVTFPTAAEAVRWAKNHYGVHRVTVVSSSKPAA